MNPKLKEKITESVAAVLPITLIVLCISIFLAPMDLGNIALFFTGACLLVVGMSMFQLGSEMAMTPLGEGIGVQLSKTKKTVLLILAKKEQKKAIMEAISQSCGAKTDAHGVVISLPVDEVAGLKKEIN